MTAEIDASLAPTTYDCVPYPAGSYPQSHPRHLATIGALFGMQPADIRTARILELGAADGANLLPMAVELPDATFVGIERAGSQARAGQDTINALGLKNIRIVHGDIMNVDAALGQFDYIIAHGVFSWVPADVQEKIVSICKENLHPNGIAYISYNTYPGWCMRGMVRDMMMFHTRQVTDPQSKAQQARALVEFLADAVPVQNNPYGLWLTQELKNMQGWQDRYLLHDSLEDVNEPLYFWQFMERATDHNLRYLGDADFSTMIADNFTNQVRETLQRVGRNIVAMEQYMDFIRNRMFRRTLLCHQDVSLQRKLSPQRVEQFHIRSAAKPLAGNPETHAPTPKTFVSASGAALTASAPIVEAALSWLAERYPHAVSFDETLQHASAAVNSRSDDASEQQRIVLAEWMLSAFAADKIELTRFADRFTGKVGPRPRTTALARRQALAGAQVTNLRHQSITLDAVSRVLTQHLDGERDHAALVAILARSALAGQLAVQENGQQITDAKRLSTILTTQLDGFLAHCAACALLCE